MPVLVGGTGVVIYKGKEYHRGDNVPMTREETEHHARFAGLVFEGDPSLDPDATPMATTTTTEGEPLPVNATTGTLQPPTEERRSRR